MPNEPKSFSLKAERAAAVCFVGDERVRRYANVYVDRPALFSSPFVAVAYVFPEFGFADVFANGALNAEIAQCLHNESLGGSYGSFDHSDAVRLHRSFLPGRAGQWRHGVNLAVDPALVFAFGAVDVEEIAAEIPASKLDEEIDRRIVSFEKAIAHVLSEGFEHLSILSIGSRSKAHDRGAGIARRFDNHLARLAQSKGVELLDAGEPSAVMDAILNARLRRRAQRSF